MIDTEVLAPRDGGPTERQFEGPPKKDRLGPVVGDLILHPVVLVSFALLGLNDHVFKAHFASWWTGKLSDVAGMMGFPLFVVAGLETSRSVFRWVRGGRFRHDPIGYRAGTACVFLTGGVFAMVNVSDLAGRIYVRIVELLWAPWACLESSLVAPHTVGHVVDPTDLIALPFLVVPWFVIRNRNEP